MNPRYLSSSILLQRPLPLRLVDAVADRWVGLTCRLRGWHAERSERRRAERAERQLAGLSLRTLQDIGAPHGLIGQRRWQDEQDAALQAIGHPRGC